MAEFIQKAIISSNNTVVITPVISLMTDQGSCVKASLSESVNKTCQTILNTDTKGNFLDSQETISIGVEDKETTTLIVEEEDLILNGQAQQYGSSSGTVGWSKAAVLKLIQLHNEHQHLFDDPHYKKKSVWEMVSMCMQKEGYAYSWIQAENKWKAITKKYRDTVDHNAKHGHIIMRKCPFYNELATVYRYVSPCLSQAAPSCQAAFKSLVSDNSFQQTTIAVVTNQIPNTAKRPLQCDSDPTASTSSTELKNNNVDGQGPREEPVGHKVLIKKKKYSPIAGDNVSDVGQVLHMLRVLNEDRRKQEKLRMDRLEKMHQERMTVFREFLDVLKNSVNNKSSCQKKGGNDGCDTCTCRGNRL
ncbi:unnamed protein product [Lymnaea stagnalis]|uniref:Myb/SANT-like DNA-binding domain-containing protein n=1 Tax=Lymnaea stagnalis TaxID=6523 RepID=A0AAV2HQB6_LYMST